MTTFSVPGKPKALERPKFTRKGIAYTPKASQMAKAFVALCARRAQVELIEGPVRLEVVFTFAMPMRRLPHHRAGSPCVKRPDVDNLVKLVKDALEGIAYRNDSQVVEVIASKVWGEEHGTTITLSEVKSQDVEHTVH